MENLTNKQAIGIINILITDEESDFKAIENNPIFTEEYKSERKRAKNLRVKSLEMAMTALEKTI